MSDDNIINLFGEVMQAGDEYDACVDGWRDPAKWVPVIDEQIGVVAPDPQYPSHRQFRRRVKTND